MKGRTPLIHATKAMPTLPFHEESNAFLAARADDVFARLDDHTRLSSHMPWRWLGRFLGRYYARWCTETMVADATRHFTKARAA